MLVACAVYLFDTNSATEVWAQGYDPLGRWWLSTMVAALPVLEIGRAHV